MTTDTLGLLRPEARPATWQQLTEPQRQSILKVLRLLFNAVQDAKKDPVLDTKVPWLDRDRASQLAFLAGARGAGKTTVLMSAARAVSTGRFSDIGLATTEAIDHEVAAMLPELSQSVIWLEPIDAEPESTQTNMLAAIVARIERATESYTTTTNDADDYGHTDFDPDTPGEQALAKLSRLQTSMALAWARSPIPNADADTFAIEVRRRERAKLGIQQELNTVLRELGEHVFHIKRPVFVLPVDDIDLNPRLCADLIKLLRSVAVPHLFAIALGDISLTEFVMQLNYAAEFKANGADLNWLELDGKIVTRRIAEVAAHNLRKLIPPQQRIVLTNTTLEQALRFLPLGYHDRANLGSVMDSIRFEVAPLLQPFARFVSPAGLSVLDFLLTPRSQLVVGKPTADPTSTPTTPTLHARCARACYQGRLHLETTQRRLADLWAIWASQGPRNTGDAPTPAINSEEAREIRRRLSGHLASVLNEDSQLSAYANVRALSQRGESNPLSAEDLQKVFRLLPRVRDDRRVGSDGVESKSQQIAGVAPEETEGASSDPTPEDEAPARTEHSADTDPASRFECKFHVWDHWDLGVRVEAPDRKVPTSTIEHVDLPAHVVAAVLLVHDVSQLLSETDPSSGLMRYAHEVDPVNTLAETSWFRDEGPTQHGTSFAWPAPSCITTWQWDWFAAAWSERVRDEGWLSRDLEEVALTWILLGTSVLDGKAPEHPGSTQLWSRLFGRSGRINELAGAPTIRAPRTREWLLDCCALLMPEYGVCSSYAKNKALGSKLTAFIHRESVALFAGHKRRIERLRRSAGLEVAEIVKQNAMGTDSPFQIFDSYW